MTADLSRLALASLALLFFVAPGLGIAELVRPLRKLPFALRVAWGYLLGVAWVAGASYAASHLFAIPFKRSLFLPLALVPAAAGAARSLVVRREGRSRPGARDPLAAAALATAGLFCAGLFAEALRNPLSDWDGRMTWFAQARFIREERTVDAAALRDPANYVPCCRRYPLLMPVAQVAAQETLNLSDDERTIRPVYAAFLPAFLLVVYAGAMRLAGRRAAALTALTACVVPYFAFWNHGGPAGGYSDFPLACFAGAAGLLLLLGDGPGRGLAAGVLLAAAVLTKREGLPTAVAVLGVVALWAIASRRGSDRLRALSCVAAAAVCVAASAALFAHWASGIPDTWDQGYAQTLSSRDTLTMLPDRLARTVPTIWLQTFDRSQWGVFWIAFALIAVVGRRAFARPRVRALAALACIAPALGLAAYGVNWDPPVLAKVTWSRFLVQASLPTLLVFAALLQAAWRPARPPGSRAAQRIAASS